MKSNIRRAILRVQQVAGVGLLSLMAAIYADSASAATYKCTVTTLAGATIAGPIDITANTTPDALNQAKAAFNAQGVNTSVGWIFCNL
ncbi:hypothetical protein OC610_07590 [Pseudomonas sp. SAICEU22]|uniref:Uncharacterized protein n=1 Tax=Pseudomonas agronomica TaxID=2979328 RepID=A0ABT3F5B8_9PSED|nr:hypothetical protein [Pseudomonas agronomica]MCW1244263.1 hypothetical protein [Pseudomonas agronomica]